MLALHRAERADRLVEALARLLADPLDDPFTAEVVAVPTRGLERWLNQRLAGVLGASPAEDGHGADGPPVPGGDGVCANVAYPFPRRLVGDAVAVASGIDRDADPWLPERLVWPLLEVVDGCLREEWLAPLAAHLGAGDADDEPSRRERRFSAVRHLAQLYDGYAAVRPELLRTWANGSGGDAALPTDAVWQARLWRRLRAHVGLPSPPERLAGACARIRAEPGVLDLPPRLALFGLTRLPASLVEVLSAIAAARDVHLFLLHPSGALWERVKAAAGPAGALSRRRDDPTAALARHPLLASWGQDARELQLVLRTAAAGTAADDVHYATAAASESLLARIQADVRDDRCPPGPPLPGSPDPRPCLQAGDRSVQVHACHGQARQVEVLRDAILQLLADDPTLEPRDVIVLCPDIDAFAPLISATFGLAQEGATVHGAPQRLPEGAAAALGPDLRVRLADRALRQTNPVLGVVAELLTLAGGRLTASQALELASREPVRRRFGFDDDDLSRIQEWVAAANVRWGLDAPARAAFLLDRVATGTWRLGLDRILAGVASAEDGARLIGGVLPLDDVPSGDIDLVGRLAELLDRLGAAIGALTQPQTIAAWVDAIGDAADWLTAVEGADAWQHAQLQQLLDEVLAEATAQPRAGPGARPPQGDPDGPAGASGVKLSLAEVAALLGDRLQGQPTRANFRTGHLTMCTLHPMRSVPHRVVCLLGLDDGQFPRRTVPDGDDLLARDPLVGDRDPRSEDRQLLLDALLAATETLVVTYAGRDERTNAARPPAVPLGELLDVIDATVRVDADGGRPRAARHAVVVAHPLQPFAERNFQSGALAAAGPWSFDPVALAGAQAARTPRGRGAMPFLPQRLPARSSSVVELEQLVRFVQHPVKAFLRQRLDLSLSRRDETLLDALSVELDGLQQWTVGQRLLEDRLAGACATAAWRAAVGRGDLPPGALGEAVLRWIEPVVERIVAAAQIATATADGAPSAAPAGLTGDTVDVAVDLGGGRTVGGTVTGARGDLIQAVTYSRVAAKHRLAAWVRLMAATASEPERPFTAVTVGRGGGSSATVAELPALGPDPAARHAAALRHLRVLVDLYDRGLREPLPLSCKASAAWAEARVRGEDPVAAGRDEWDSRFKHDGEDRDPEHVLVHRGEVAFTALLDAEPLSDEQGDGWDREPCRFGRLATRLWSGLLAHEAAAPR